LKPNQHSIANYRALIRELLQRHGEDTAMSIAVGGDYERVGAIERALLVHAGLMPQHRLVDVGCGSGRLATALAGYLQGGYLGTDVVPEMLDYARRKSPAAWRFELSETLTIPCADAWADCICFFSVFTHLLPEESYCYLLDARRALRPGGLLVFSFLEYAFNWQIFEGTVNLVRAGRELPHLNIFIGRDAIELWCRHLNLEVLSIHGAADRFIPFAQPVTLAHGEVLTGPAALGQSVVMARKRG
jgi:SAM-dependent methyltransferase